MLGKLKVSLYGFVKYQPLLRELVIRDLKVRYRHSALGMLWTVLNPLLSMAVLTIVFSNIFRFDIENFAVYVLIGNIVFFANSDATTQGMNSILWNASLIKKVYIPKYLFPLSNVVSCLINFMFSFVALLIVMLITKAPFHLTLLTSWIPLIYLTVFSFGLSLFLCVINVFFRDMQHIYSVFTTAWMYFSAIFYSVDLLTPLLKQAIWWNPLYQYISFFRSIIMDGVFPSLEQNLVCMAWSFGVFILGMISFYRLQDRFILHI